MKKGIFATLLFVCMAVVLMPAGFAFADSVTAGAFTVTSDSTLTEGTDYSYSDGTLTILSDKEVTIANTNPEATGDSIAVADGVNANITLAGVNISTGWYVAAFRIADNSTGNVTITLADGTNNTLRSGNDCAGLQKNGVASPGTLTITGTGALTVQGGDSAAGIGGGKNSATANIKIEGGTIISTAGRIGAGIGSGMGTWDTVSNIKIAGGTVTANGSYGGAGIGGSSGGDAANITIEGGTVTANGGSGDAYVRSGAGIGGGGGGNCWAVTISGGSVKANPGTDATPIGGGNGAVTPTNGTESVYLLEMDGASNSLTIDGIAYPADHGDGKVYVYLSEGEHTIVKDGVSTTHIYKVTADNTLEAIVLDFTVTATNSGETLISGVDYTYPEDTGQLTIISNKAITIRNNDPSTPTTNTIVVAAGVDANITLAGVNIGVQGCPLMIADNSMGDVTITLAEGTTNTLIASGNYAGLQKNGITNPGTLTITGTGMLIAQGGYDAAGIGSRGTPGDYSETANITIQGGTIIATGGSSGAGIGGGVLGDAFNITISGGIVTATGGRSGAGIGGGDNGNGSNITISGGIVTATGGDTGAGIGGGFSGSGSDITIQGGSVKAIPGKAFAGEDASSIGGGVKGNGAVTPTDGTMDVHLLEIDNAGGADIAINDTDYPDTHISYDSNGAMSEEDRIYAYLPSKTLAVPNVVTIGDTTAKYYWANQWIRVVDGDFEITLDAPVTGSALDTTAQLADDTNIGSVSSVTWKAGAAQADVNAICGTAYTAEITISPQAGCAFSADATARVNGNEATITNDNGAITVAYTFDETVHVWGEAVYEWSEGEQSCTATRTCVGNATHAESELASITSAQTKAPTCTQQGETTYTATFESDWAEQQTKVLANISATGHSWGEPDYIWGEDGNTCTATRTCSKDSSHTETAVGQIVSERTKEPTYTEPGETTYTATFAEGWADTQTTTIADIPATGSDWYATEYQWSTDGKTCTASRTHKTEQGRIETLEVTAVGKQVKPPTCTEDGATRYTAAFDTEWTTPQSMIVEDLPATAHRWSEIAYIWSDDGHTCTAARTCMNDSTHVQTADAEITHVQTKEPSCTEKGTTTYTASFEADWAAEQTKLIADLPAAGHGETRLENMKEPTCTEEGYTGDKVCTVCGEVVEAGTTIEKIAHSFGDWTVVAQPTATEKGEQQRICTICGSVEKQEIPATSTAGDQTAPGQKDTELPQTGDKANLGLWSVLFFGSVLGLLAAIFLRRKKA